jgi:hypothetical protein
MGEQHGAWWAPRQAFELNRCNRPPLAQHAPSVHLLSDLAGTVHSESHPYPRLPKHCRPRYLPYPQEVLGLSSCGVQLDEGGRLVFRGPRFKMGLSEGTPKIIMPDHLGR